MSETFDTRHQTCIAWIDEHNCIGCTKCIKVCPVNAIVGSRRTVHTVINTLCTNCNICITICPTSCIKIRPLVITSTKQ